MINIQHCVSFSFSIDRLTDPLKQFSVDGNGLVTTTKLLDRETTPVHKLHILAIDKGVYLSPLCIVILYIKQLIIVPYFHTNNPQVV